MFDGIFNKDSLTKGGAATLAVMLALNLTSGQKKVIQGAAAFGAAIVALKLAAKL